MQNPQDPELLKVTLANEYGLKTYFQPSVIEDEETGIQTPLDGYIFIMEGHEFNASDDIVDWDE